MEYMYHMCRRCAVDFVDRHYLMLCVVDGCQTRLTVVESASSSWNLVCGHGIRFVIMESGSLLSNLLCRRWIYLANVKPALLSLNPPCWCRTWVGVGSCDIVELFRWLLRWPGIRYRTGQWDGRNKRIAKTSHDVCCGSCFVMHFTGLPIPGSPSCLPLPNSFVG